MTPPALNIGWEFTQSTPTVFQGKNFPTSAVNSVEWGVSPALPLNNGGIPVAQIAMTAYKVRLSLKADVQVHIKVSWNIDTLFYNELTFDLNQFAAKFFTDIIVVYYSQEPTAAQVAVNPILPYTFNLCSATGYNINDITLSFDMLFKYPNCYKNLLTSLTDFSQWTKIIYNFGKNPYLYGLLDACTMSTDSV